VVLAAEVSGLVLDSWPILEWLKGRAPASSIFREIIEAALEDKVSLSMSRMNYGEVVYSVMKDFPADQLDQIFKAFREIPIHFYSVDDALVDAAASLKSFHAISYADAFAAALAMRLNLPLLTGDREFLVLQQIGLKVHWLGA
jgi:predicted nucleic acid-binding protein